MWFFVVIGMAVILGYVGMLIFWPLMFLKNPTGFKVLPKKEKKQ